MQHVPSSPDRYPNRRSMVRETAPKPNPPVTSVMGLSIGLPNHMRIVVVMHATATTIRILNSKVKTRRTVIGLLPVRVILETNSIRFLRATLPNTDRVERVTSRRLQEPRSCLTEWFVWGTKEG